MVDGGTLRINLPEVRFLNAEDVITSNISIETGPDNVVEVAIYYVSGRMAWAGGIVRSINPTTIQLQGDRVRRVQPSWAHRVTLFIEVRLPERFNVSVRNHRGEVNLELLQGSLVVESASGDIRIGAVRGPEISISTQTGSVSADLLETDNGRVTTISGNIDINTLRGEMYAATSTGDVRVLRAEGSTTTLKSATGNISIGIRDLAATTLVANDGDISIRAPASIAAEVYFEADTIDVDSVFELHARSTARTLRGSLNRGGPRLEAMTARGTVRLLAWSER